MKLCYKPDRWASPPLQSTQTLVRAINDRSTLKELFGIIHDILNLSLEFSVTSFSYITRSNNSAADGLAKGALLSATCVS